MTFDLYAGLRWLPAAPADFATQCRALPGSPDAIGRQAQRLASHALDENQLNRLANALGKARAAGVSLSPLTPFRLGIVSNATSHFLVPVLVATAARHGIALECIEADYDQAMQAALRSRFVDQSRPLRRRAGGDRLPRPAARLHPRRLRRCATDGRSRARPI